MVVGRGDCRCGGDYRCGGGCVVGGGPCLHGRCLVLVVMVMLLKDVVLDDFYTGILFILTTVCLWCVFRFHPRSVLVLESFQADSQLHPFDLFGLGQTAWTDQHQNPADEVSGQVFLSLSLCLPHSSPLSHTLSLSCSVSFPQVWTLTQFLVVKGAFPHLHGHFYVHHCHRLRTRLQIYAAGFLAG